MFFSNRTWRPSPISIPPFKTTQTQLQPHWFTNNVLFLDLFGTPSYTPQCNCMEKCLTNQCPKHAATCQLSYHGWMHIHDIHTLPSTYLCTSARQKRHMNKLYVFVSDVLVHPVKVRWTPGPPRCVFSWARCHEINWNPTKNIQRLPRYIVQCSKVVHLLCICGRNAWCLTRTCTYKQLFLPGWHMVVTNWKKKNEKNIY